MFFLKTFFYVVLQILKSAFTGTSKSPRVTPFCLVFFMIKMKQNLKRWFKFEILPPGITFMRIPQIDFRSIWVFFVFVFCFLFFFLPGFSFADIDNSQDSRGREGTIFYSTLPLSPAHEHSDINLHVR